MSRPAFLLVLAVLAAVVSAACSDVPLLGGSSGDGDGDGDGENKPPPDYNDPRTPEIEELPNPLEGLPTGQAQLDIVCARGERNAVTRALCGGQRIGSLVELEEALGLGFDDRSADGQNGAGGNPGFAFLGHSSSLVARSVSAINPRVFLFSPPPGRPARIQNYVVMGFVRGEPLVEIAAEDASNNRKLTFYLLKFDLQCEARHDCKPGDLLTPDVEKNWTGFSLYDDEDLKNTIADCRHCHQPNANQRPFLRMQELQDPWTHWFRNDRPGGVALTADFLRAHGDEEYGGVPGNFAEKADGRALEDLIVGQGFGQQPNMFDSETIEEEVEASSSQQPEINTPVGKSSTWETLYERALQGDFIPVPYHDVKVTDPNKLQFATDAYRGFRAGTLPKAELPDIRRVFLDDALEALLFRPKKGSTGKEVLIQACAQCHNPRLDQSISRAKFDVTKLDTMDRAMKDKAIKRLKLPPSDLLHMPPALMRSMSDEAMGAALAELAK